MEPRTAWEPWYDLGTPVQIRDPRYYLGTSGQPRAPWYGLGTSGQAGNPHHGMRAHSMAQGNSGLLGHPSMVTASRPQQRGAQAGPCRRH